MNKYELMAGIVISVILISCHANDKPPRPKYIFETELKVITSSFNQNASTCSVLYGNDKALSACSNPKADHQPGENYQMVTWAIGPHPLWYGGYSSRAIQRVETVQTILLIDGTMSIRYQDDSGLPNMDSGNRSRASFIIHQKASGFP